MTSPCERSQRSEPPPKSWVCSLLRIAGVSGRRIGSVRAAWQSGDVLQPLEKAILVAIDRITRDRYTSTDSDEVAGELKAMGFELPAALLYERLFGQLRDAGYLGDATTRTGGGRVVHVELTSYGREVAREDADPMEEVHLAMRRLFSSVLFAKAYPGAFGPWAEAEKLLFGDQPESQLANIGFNCRDALQAFAGEFQERYPPDEPDPDPTHTKNRLRAVIQTYKPRIGERRAAMLDRVLDLWDADVDLIQRQTHANERPGKPLNVNDGRRVVSLTMFLMIEFATILDDMDDPPPPATLEPAG